VVPGERLADILDAATPPPPGWFRRASDTFWDVLRSHSRELEGFGWSGWAFSTLDLYLDARYGFMYGAFGDTDGSTMLTKARGSYWLVLPASAAAELLLALESVECGTEDVAAFLVDERGAQANADEATAMQAALATLRSWLAQVPPGSVGLHSVG
jgi:hypothetical protein